MMANADGHVWYGPYNPDETTVLARTDALGLDPLLELAKTKGADAGLVDTFIGKMTSWALFGHCQGLAGAFCKDDSIFGAHRISTTRYNVETLAHTMTKNVIHQAHLRSNDKTTRQPPVNDVTRNLYCYSVGDGPYGIVFSADMTIKSRMCDKYPLDAEGFEFKAVNTKTYSKSVNMSVDGVPVFHEFQEPELASCKQEDIFWKGRDERIQAVLRAETVEIPLATITALAKTICDKYEDLIVAASAAQQGWKTTKTKSGKTITAKMKGFRYLIGRLNLQLELTAEARAHFQKGKNEQKAKAQGIGKEIAGLIEREDLFKNDLGEIQKAWKKTVAGVAIEKRAELIPPAEIKLIRCIKKLAKMTTGLGSVLTDLKRLATTLSYEKRRDILAPLMRGFANALNYMEKDDRTNYVVPLFELMRTTDLNHPSNRNMIARFMYWQGRQHTRTVAMDSAHFITHDEDSMIALFSVYGGDTPVNNLRHFFGISLLTVENFSRTWTTIDAGVIAAQPKVGDPVVIIIRKEGTPTVSYMIDTQANKKRETMNGLLSLSGKTPAVRGIAVNLAKGTQQGSGNFIRFAREVLDIDLFSKPDSWVKPTWNPATKVWDLDPLEPVNFLDLSRNVSGRILLAKDGPYAGSLITHAGKVFFIHDIRREAAAIKIGRSSCNDLTIATLSIIVDKDLTTENSKKLLKVIKDLAHSYGVPNDHIDIHLNTDTLFKTQNVVIPTLNLRTLRPVPMSEGGLEQAGSSFVPEDVTMDDEDIEEQEAPKEEEQPRRRPKMNIPPHPRMRKDRKTKAPSVLKADLKKVMEVYLKDQNPAGAITEAKKRLQGALLRDVVSFIATSPSKDDFLAGMKRMYKSSE